MVAEDDLADVEIAEQCSIKERQLRNWKQLPEFEARRAQHVADITAQIMRTSYSRVDKRLGLLHRNVNRLEAIIGAKAQQVLKERAAVREKLSEALDDDEQMERHYLNQLGELAAQPGAEQGLHTRKETPVKHGVQIEYLIGTQLIAEERALLKHIAVETGDWIERISGNISLDAALAGLLGKVGPEAEGAGAGDSGDMADQTPA